MGLRADDITKGRGVVLQSGPYIMTNFSHMVDKTHCCAPSFAPGSRHRGVTDVTCHVIT